MSHPPIEAGGVSLRPTEVSDLAILRSFFENPGFNEHWGGSPLPDSEITAKYLGARSPSVECFLVVVAREPVGLMQYWCAVDGADSGGIDLALVPSARGSGIGTVAVDAMVQYLRTERRWERITVDPDVTNTRGVKFWRQVGFQDERLVDTEEDREPYWLMSWPARPAE